MVSAQKNEVFHKRLTSYISLVSYFKQVFLQNFRRANDVNGGKNIYFQQEYET